MRKALKWESTSTMFGHSYQLVSDTETLPVVENIENNWMEKQKAIRKYFWFRAPTITMAQLARTVDFLGEMDGAIYFEVWQNDKTFDASLKLNQETDAASVAWSLTEIWMKWSKAQEKELVAKNKKLKGSNVKVHKDGRVTVQVSVSSIGE